MSDHVLRLRIDTFDGRIVLNCKPCQRSANYHRDRLCALEAEAGDSLIVAEMKKQCSRGNLCEVQLQRRPLSIRHPI
jgi:hypothetical protein